MDKIVEGFGFNSESVRSDDKQGMILYSRAVRAMREAKSGIAGWVHSIAVRYNNPQSPMLAATQFTNKMEELVEFITSEAAGENQLELKDCKLTGGNPLSAAFRKVRAAMELGADLTQEDTCSKCDKFAREMTEKKKEAERMAAVAAELSAQGIDPNSKEGLALIQGKKSENTLDEEGDEFDQLGKEFADALRKLSDINPGQARDMGKAAISRVAGAVQKALQNQASSSGLVEESKVA